MRGSEWKRREFLKVMMSLPLGYALGCSGESRTSPQESLRKLVLAVGPWPDGRRDRAEEFVERFLAAEHLVGLYLPEREEAILALARRFPDAAMSVREMDLAVLSAEERELAVDLVQQLYSLIEVRFELAREPRWGVCWGDRSRYTRAPG